MKHIFRNGHGVRQRAIRDAHKPETLYIETETNDAPGLRANERIRRERLLQRDARNPMVDGDVIAFSFSFPTTMDYELAKRANPQVFHDLLNGTDDERTRAAERLQILYPQYVTTVPRNDARRKHARKTV